MSALHFFAPVATWNSGASRWWGLPFVGLGIALVLRSVLRFRGRTTIRPFERSDELVVDGFYRVSRNPMYTGLLVSLCGAFVMFGTLSPGFAIPVFVCWMSTRFIESEERMLEEQFGERYRVYKSRVRRWL